MTTVINKLEHIQRTLYPVNAKHIQAHAELLQNKAKQNSKAIYTKCQLNESRLEISNKNDGKYNIWELRVSLVR